MPYDPQSLLDLRNRVLPPGGPAFNTGALGGPEGASPWGMALWNFARNLLNPSITQEQGQVGAPLGLLGGVGVLQGPGAWALKNALPDKLAKHMTKIPEKFWVPTPQADARFAGRFLPGGGSQDFVGDISMGLEQNKTTPIHEALHALFYKKNRGAGALTMEDRLLAAYPKNDQAMQIAAMMATKDPTLIDKYNAYRNLGFSGDQAMREAAVEGDRKSVV